MFFRKIEKDERLLGKLSVRDAKIGGLAVFISNRKNEMGERSVTLSNRRFVPGGEKVGVKSDSRPSSRKKGTNKKKTADVTFGP